jgi:hypothetical protein
MLQRALEHDQDDLAKPEYTRSDGESLKEVLVCLRSQIIARVP